MHSPPPSLAPKPDPAADSLLAGDEKWEAVVLPTHESGWDYDDESSAPPWRRDPAVARAVSKSLVALTTLVLAAVATYVVPDLAPLQPWRADEDYVPFWNLIGREWMGQGEVLAQDEAALQRLNDEMAAVLDEQARLQEQVVREVAAVEANRFARFPPYVAREGEPHEVAVGLEFADRLDGFFRALTRSDLAIEGAVTRVSHWGDSVLGNDGISAAVRNALQARFGDAGHGFHAITQFDPSYQQKGVIFKEVSSWDPCYVIHQRRCGADGHYGLGGAFGTSSGGAQSRFATAVEGAFGRKVARFELYFAALPKGGNLQLQIDQRPPVKISTASSAIEDRFYPIEVDDGPHRLAVVAAGGGPVRVYGVTLERPGPGVVWDGMALIGAFTSRLSRQDPDHFAGQVAHRNPDMVVLMFGGNDMTREQSDLARTMAPYEEDLSELVRTVRRGKPQASCLIMAPIDHGERVDGKIVGRAIVPRMVAAQRRVAQREGCGFFDTLAAMGGSGSIARWFRRDPRWASGDLSHPTHHGHKVIGAGLLYPALITAYREYRHKMVGQPLEASGGQAPSTPKANGVTQADGTTASTAAGEASTGTPTKGR